MNCSLDITTLLQRYRNGTLNPMDVVEGILARIKNHPADDAIWIHVLPRETIAEFIAAILTQDPASLPLYGIPFAIKDNIDLAGVPTTAACPDFAYTPQASATAVTRLLAAGAIPIGKTNMDQFATGLVGTRSPYGLCHNAFDSAYVSGGSSSGSALAVAQGMVSFALGTDTAGSGRIPAAFNNIVGIKPTKGLISTQGVVPACRSLDCVSIFALTCADGDAVLKAASSYDIADPYSRRTRAQSNNTLPAAFRFGVPSAEHLQFFGDDAYAELFAQSVRQLEALGGERVEIDWQPFNDAALLLYNGPWVAERYASVGEFCATHPQSTHPVVGEIIRKGNGFDAIATFRAQYELQALTQAAHAQLERVDLVLTPTAGTIHRIADVLHEPIKLNSQLGYYTNFMNLLDLSAVAVPSGFRTDGLPFGVTLFAPALHDNKLIALADRLHRHHDVRVGNTTMALSATPALMHAPKTHNTVRVAVCGAHLSGLPLNSQLTERGGSLIQKTSTAPQYQLYALPGGPPFRPGLIRSENGACVEVEVWELPLTEFGSFVAGIPAPLGIGTLTLKDSTTVLGFLCEAYAIKEATNITHYGGWRAYLAAERPR